MTALASAPARPKPRLRGVSHQLAAIAWPFAALALFGDASDGLTIAAVVVYTLSAVGLFSTSALYHRVTWSPAARRRMRRLDHAAIFLLIAGTYTPICLLGLGVEAGTLPLIIVWIGAALGIAKTLFWIGSPKWITAVLAVGVGWAPMIEWRILVEALAPVGVALMVAGGVLYTLGALAYAAKRPDPWPKTFGYHEVFHALVVAAAICHLALVAHVV